MFKKRWVKWLAVLFGLVITFFIGLYVAIYIGVFGKLPTQEDLRSIKQEQATQVLDKDGLLLGKYYIYDRQPLRYDDFPQHLIDALIATEDVRFYEHNGIDNTSLVRVFVKSILLQKKSAGGGSTISLQLAKNLFGRKNYLFLGTVINKLKESIIATRIEEIYSKKDILTLYLNTVPFSDNTYGIESASRKFFDKAASQLSVLEAATLVGTLKANSFYNPRKRPENCRNRRDVVLSQMAKYNYIDTKTKDSLQKQDLVLEYRSFSHDLGVAPYFREAVKKELQHILDTLVSHEGDSYDLYRDGLIVYTTLDYKMQRLAEEAVQEHMSKLQKNYEDSYGKLAPWIQNKHLVDGVFKALPEYNRLKELGLSMEQIEDSLSVKRPVELFSWSGDVIENISVKDSIKHYLKLLNTGMLSIEPKTGAVRSYIGGIDYRFFKYDHVSQSTRQVGSTFKPFVYTAAIEKGMDPCTYFSLSEVTYTNYDNWTPRNSGKDQDTPFINYTLEKALSQSVNTVSVKVLNEVGISNVIDLSNKLGIPEKLPNKPALALGVAEINLKHLTGAYASYVNKGKGVKPYYIERIEDKHGNVIADFKPNVLDDPAYNEYTRQVLLEMMKSTVNSGTASRLRSTYGLHNEIAGKTGTTQNNKDGWFVGITPNLVTVTWVGNDNHAIGFKTTALGQGANSALPIFAKFYQKLNEATEFDGITQAQFEHPSEQVIEDLDCEPEKRDSFIKRLFSKKKKTKKFKGNK